MRANQSEWEWRPNWNMHKTKIVRSASWKIAQFSGSDGRKLKIKLCLQTQLHRERERLAHTNWPTLFVNEWKIKFGAHKRKEIHQQNGQNEFRKMFGKKTTDFLRKIKASVLQCIYVWFMSNAIGFIVGFSIYLNNKNAKHTHTRIHRPDK